MAVMDAAVPKGFQGVNVTELDGACYIQIRQAKVAETKTIEAKPNELNRMYNVDYDTWGRVVGIEIL